MELRARVFVATHDLPVYVISLPTAGSRRRNMTAQLNTAGIPFRFVDAVDALSGPVPDYFDGVPVFRERFSSDALIGCTMSHRLVHRMIAGGRHDVGLVFEDDVALAEDFPRVLPAAVALDFDILKLEGARYIDRRAAVGRIGNRSVVVREAPSLGAAAYLIRRSAAARFCSLPAIDQVIDLAFDDPRLHLRVLELEPFPAIQDPNIPSSIIITRSVPREPPWRVRFIEKVVKSARKRTRRWKLYGFRVVLSLEWQKFRQTNTLFFK